MAHKSKYWKEADFDVSNYARTMKMDSVPGTSLENAAMFEKSELCKEDVAFTKFCGRSGL